MTLAMAALDTHRATVAADSLQVVLRTDGSVTTGIVAKTARSATWVGVSAGVVALDEGDLNAELLKLAETDVPLRDAAVHLVDAAGGLLGPHGSYFATRFDDGDVVWEFILLSHLGPPGSGSGVRFRAYLNREARALVPQVEDIAHARESTGATGPGGRPHLDRPQAWALGNAHPELRLFGQDYHNEYDDLLTAATWGRTATPRPPRALPNAYSSTVHELVQRAVQTQARCRRHAWWPTTVPVAASPVTVATTD